MTIDITLTHIITLALAIVGGIAFLIRTIVSQFDKRLDEKFQAQESSRKSAAEVWDKRFSGLDESNRRQERELLELKADLPKLYVQREDWIRFGATVDAKLDRLHTMITHLTKGQGHE